MAAFDHQGPVECRLSTSLGRAKRKSLKQNSGGHDSSRRSSGCHSEDDTYGFGSLFSHREEDPDGRVAGERPPRLPWKVFLVVELSVAPRS
jgi:hypothetical protein